MAFEVSTQTLPAQGTITRLDQLDPNGFYTYGDYLRWRFTEWVELIKGHIWQMAAPSTKHGRVSLDLASVLNVKLKGQCTVFHAPFDVRLSTTNNYGEATTTVLQPDICVICDKSKLDERGCAGAPSLVIEILSPGSIRHDTVRKREAYAEGGVPEYWIVHPLDRYIEVLVLDGPSYKLHSVAVAEDGEAVTSATIAGLTVPLSEFLAVE